MMTMNVINLSYIFIVISQVKNFFNNVSSLFYGIASLIGYKRFYIRTKESKNLLLKNVQKKHTIFCSKFDENMEPCGLIIHNSLFPQFIINCEDYDGYYIFCKTSFFDEIMQIEYNNENLVLNKDFIPESGMKEPKEADDGPKNMKIKYLVKKGDYGYFQYNTRRICLTQTKKQTDLNFFAYQEKLFQTIMNFYKSNNYCKIFLSGDPGCGKTYFAYIMAQKLGCYLCDSFDPNEPSSNFNEIYSLVKVSARCPLIVLIDEVDILIRKIHNPKIQNEHKKFSREIFDKTSYNNFMDKIEFGLYPNVILLMNSNQNKESIDRLDKAYLRNGRVNVIEKW